MAIVRNPPNTIWLGGLGTVIGDIAAGGSITPGHLLERFNSSGVWRWRAHSTGGGNTAPAVALAQHLVNKGVDDVYNTNDLVDAVVLSPGATAWMLIASGQNIVFGNQLESAGNGTLRILASGTPLFTALETQANVVVQTRIRVEAI